MHDLLHLPVEHMISARLLPHSGDGSMATECPAPLISGIVQVHIVHPGSISLEQAESYLTEPERTRAATFRFPEDALHWTRCRAALRSILAAQLNCTPREVPITLGPYGKPLLADAQLHFNLSHERDIALVALSLDGPVGIDIEHRRRASDLTECAATFCHPNELAALPSDKEARDLELLRIWTAKEAYLKALGTGLSIPPESVSLLGADLRDHSGLTLRLSRLEHPDLTDHLAHLCAPGSKK
jgi:4'-phosphopantetheinyl transferase